MQNKETSKKTDPWRLVQRSHFIHSKKP
jgi:hypothetical protein